MLRAIAYHARQIGYGLLRGPRAVLLMLLAPFRWFGALLTQISEWWSRRETRYLLRGLPSVFVFVGAGLLIVACRLQSDAALAESYLSAAAAREANDPKVAALLLERVVLLRPDDNDDETLFRLASNAQRAGDQARTAILMQQLAPDDKPRYWPAHLEMARTYQKVRQQSLASFQKAEAHFRYAIELNPNSANAHGYLGQLYYNHRLWELAIEHFEKALDLGAVATGNVPSDLQVLQLLLAKAYAFNKNLKKSEELALEVRRQYAERVASRPKEDVESRIILADACMFLEDFDAAAKTLNEGFVLNSDAPGLRESIARFNVSWTDALKQEQIETGQDTSAKRFELLSTALLLDPHNVLIFDRMMGILRDKGETSDAARKFLVSNVTEGKSIGLSHLLLGSAALEAKDPQTAALHLERAYERLPNALIVTNNLAWFLAYKVDPDLDRALALIDNVLMRAPDDARFLDTRGQILTKLERWDDAISDLERALEQGIPGAETHVALAQCYGAKGLPELASSHRRLGESRLPK